MKRHTALGVEEGFFDDAPRDASRVKRQIVTEYFDYYMRVMVREGKNAGHVDLFAGTGIYGSGEEASPVIISNQVASEPRLRDGVKLSVQRGRFCKLWKVENEHRCSLGHRKRRAPSPSHTSHSIGCVHPTAFRNANTQFHLCRPLWLQGSFPSPHNSGFATVWQRLHLFF